jgi:hypothetical protein
VGPLAGIVKNQRSLRILAIALIGFSAILTFRVFNSVHTSYIGQKLAKVDEPVSAPIKICENPPDVARRQCQFIHDPQVIIVNSASSSPSSSVTVEGLVEAIGAAVAAVTGLVALFLSRRSPRPKKTHQAPGVASASGRLVRPFDWAADGAFLPLPKRNDPTSSHQNGNAVRVPKDASRTPRRHSS